MTNSKSKGNILVVDDTPANLNLLTSMLSEHGYKVRLAPNGKLALRSAESTPPEVILLDILMPEIDGYQVCEQLKANLGTRDIPIIFLSALHEVSDKIKAFKVGGVDYITKPFQLEEVLTRVENQLKIGRLQKQLTQQNAQLQQEIHERKLAQKKLSNRHRLNQSILTSAPVGICLTDENGCFVEVNPAYCQLYGFTSEKLINQPFTIHFPQLSSAEKLELVERYQKFIQLQNYDQGEYTVSRQDGSKLTVYIKRSCCEQQDGKRFVVTTILDITEQKQAEEKLRTALYNAARSQASLAQAQRIAHIGSWEYHVLANKFTWSEELFRIFGLELTSSEPSYRKLFKWIHPDDRSLLQQSAAQMIAEGTSCEFNFRIVQPNGQIRHVEGRGESILNVTGEVIQLLGTVLDITERYQAEAALQTSEQKYRNLVETSQDMIWSVDSQGHYTFVNQAAKQIYGYEPAEMLGCLFTDFVASKQKPQELAVFQELIKTGSISQYETTHLTKNGRAVNLMFNAITQQDKQGNVVEITGTTSDISYRLEAQKALRLSEERFALAVAGANDGIWDWDLQSGEIYFSPRWKSLLGYADDELANTYETWEQSIHPEDLERVKSTLNTYLEGRSSSYKVEYRAHCQDNTYRWMLVRGSALRDEEGKPYRLSGSKTDITQRKHTEEALRLILEGTASSTGMEFFRSCVRYLAQVLHVHYAIFAEFTDETKTRVRTLAFWMGEDFSLNIEYDLAGTPCDNVLAGMMCHYPKCVQQHFPQDQDLVELEAESYWGIPLTNSAGEVLGHLAVLDLKPMPYDPGKEMILQIFAARAGAEVERQRAEEALQASQEKFAGILDIAEDAIISVDENQRIQLFNQGAERIFGYTAHEIIGQSLNILLPVRAQEHHQQHFSKFTTSETNARKMANRSRSVFGCRKNGTQFPAEASISKLELPEGALFTVMLKDISDRKRSEAKLQKALEAAEVANHAKSEFLANMSHELRTPLNAILGFTQVMSRDASVSSEQQESLEIISRSGEHLLELINDILEMSKIEAGRSTFNQTSFDLYHLLEGLEEMLGLKAQNKELQLMFERAPELPQYVQTDEGKLRQILINLLGNAIKFTQEGGVTLRVGVGRWGDGEMGRWGDGGDKGDKEDKQTTNNKQPTTIIFEIEDTGPGIASSDLNTIFEPFTQTATAQKFREGTGLGLPISRKFVELMGGQLTVNSTLAQGTVFRFDIPITLAQAIDNQKVETSRRVIGLAPKQRLCRILVVEDKWTNRLLLFRLLTMVGFSVCEAANGQEAIAVWEDWEPHLILMDMRMPVMDGYEATRKIKSHVKGQATVIIALTASVFEEHRSTILSVGCDDFIRKPFREQFLLEKIADYLEVQYIYEEHDQVTTIQKEKTTSDFKLQASDLSMMPTEWLRQVHLAAEACNDEEILVLMEQIPEQYGVMKSSLSKLVNNFRVDLIFDLTKVFINE